MNDPGVLRILNELLAAERSFAAGRLIESTVFVAHVGSDEYFVVQRIAEQQGEHAAWLTMLILDLGGAPGLRRDDLTTADFHFQELRTALPHLVSHLERLVRKYRLAVPKLATESAAASLVGQILSRHEDNLVRLTRPNDTPVAAAS